MRKLREGREWENGRKQVALKSKQTGNFPPFFPLQPPSLSSTLSHLDPPYTFMYLYPKYSLFRGSDDVITHVTSSPDTPPSPPIPPSQPFTPCPPIHLDVYTEDVYIWEYIDVPEASWWRHMGTYSRRGLTPPWPPLIKKIYILLAHVHLATPSYT